MTTASTPVEYKLLGAQPMAKWEPRYSVYLLMRMALTLAYDPDDLRRTRAAALVGKDAANALSAAILKFQGDGDYEGLGAFNAKYGVLSEQLHKDLARLTAKSIPVDIVYNQ